MTVNGDLRIVTDPAHFTSGRVKMTKIGKQN